MPRLELNLPPGVVRVGTELQTAGHWYDTNLVRWVDGVLQPMGGWVALTGGAGPSALVVDGAARGSHGWRDNNAAPLMAIGTHLKLYIYNGAALFDITPYSGYGAGAYGRGSYGSVRPFTTGRADTTSYLGYGVGPYGRGVYGRARAVAGGTDRATTWALANFGQILLAVNSDDGRLLEWLNDTSVDAVAVTATAGTIPMQNASMLVTDERFCVLLGAGGDPRKVAWSDSEDYTNWEITATTQAGEFILDTVGSLRTGAKARKQTILLTDNDCHVMEYVGPPLVYGFRRVGEGCGVIAPKAVAVGGDTVFWMSDGAFWSYGGNVRPLSCAVGDFVFGNINRSQAEKVHTVVLAEYTEIQWHYPSIASTEVDSYVSYNWAEGVWAIGGLGRLTGIPKGVFPTPVMIDSAGALYSHESGISYGSSAPFARSGPVELGDGGQTYTLDHMVPDEKTAGDVDVTFYARFYPNDTETERGPYSPANPTSIRVSGRQISVKVEGTASWRIGRFRFEGTVKGRR